MNTTYPCIQVNDIETTISWYIDFLEFQCTYKSSIKHPDFAALEKENQKIYIIKNESREAYASNVIVIEVENIKEEFKALEKTNVLIVQEITKGLFSENEFVIKDYEDNKLIYKQKT